MLRRYLWSILAVLLVAATIVVGRLTGQTTNPVVSACQDQIVACAYGGPTTTICCRGGNIYTCVVEVWVDQFSRRYFTNVGYCYPGDDPPPCTPRTNTCPQDEPVP